MSVADQALVSARPPAVGEEDGRPKTSVNGPCRSRRLSRSASTLDSNACPPGVKENSMSNYGTPRKSRLCDNMPSSNSNESNPYGEDMAAPLGFEPEGSIDNSVMFQEGSPLPHQKWAESMENLLEDMAGVKLFKTFLDKNAHLIDFYFICKGLGEWTYTKDDRRHAAWAAFKNYIIYNKVLLKPETIEEINRRISNRQIDDTTLRDAQNEVKTRLFNEFYPLFLKSDIYFQYVQKAMESPKLSDRSDSSDSYQQMKSSSVLNATSTSFVQPALSSSSLPRIPSSNTEQTLFNVERNVTGAVAERGEGIDHRSSASSLQLKRNVTLNHETELDTDLYMRRRQQREVGEPLDPRQLRFKSFESVESLKAHISASDTELDLNECKDILDNHISQVFSQDERSTAAFRREPDSRRWGSMAGQRPNPGDSSYVRLHRRLTEACENTMPARAAVDTMHNVSTSSGFGSRDDYFQRNCTGFQPPMLLQQRVMRDMAGIQNNQPDSRWANPNYQSTPKVKGHSYEGNSQSDSETMPQRFMSGLDYSQGYAWGHSGHPTQQSGRPCLHSSQPNLQDPSRRRTMQFVGNVSEAMPPPSMIPLPRGRQSQMSAACSASDLGYSRSRRSLMPTHTMSMSSMPPHTSYQLPFQNQASMVPGGSNAYSSSSINYYDPYVTQRRQYSHAQVSDASSTHSLPDGDQCVVTYYFRNEKIPYRTKMCGRNITLGQFKAHILKEGHFRYYFKTVCDDFESGVVYEEVFSDDALLPLYDGQIFAKVESR